MELQDGGFQDEAQRPRTGFLAEIWGWLSTNKKWWLLPVVLAALLLSLLVTLSGTPLGPWIYTLF